MVLQKRLERLLIIIISFQLFPFISVRAGQHFPMPENLKDNVEFWIKVYTKYTTDQVIIHDANHINVIYDVINLDDYFAKDVNFRIKWRQVEKIKKEYRKILLHLAHMKQPIDTQQLNEKEFRVYQLWQNIDEPRKFRTASQNIRGQKGLRDQFRRSLERSGQYMAKIQEIFRDYGLPKELCYLPHVESSFNYKAYSKMGAAGMWQFTRSTGRLFLKINYTIDERFDPIISTEAAARLLKKNYEELGSWPLAITAYNHGLMGMKRAKRILKTNDLGVIVEKYRSRSFGFASRNFYAEFLAAKEIAEHYEKYFGTVAFEPPLDYQVFELPNYVSLDALAKQFNIDKETLALYNPAFRKPILRSRRRIPRGYKIRLPKMEGFEPEKLYAALPAKDRFSDQIRDRYYKVQRGDNLGLIARRAGVSVRKIMALNDIYNPNYIREGQLLELPIGEKKVKIQKPPETKLAQADLEERETPGGGIAPTETQIAQAASRVAEETSVLGAQTSNTNAQEETESEVVTEKILDEQLAIYGPPLPPESKDGQPAKPEKTEWVFEVNFEEPRSEWIVVQPEETLGHYAEWLQLPTQKLRTINGIPYGQGIHVGQKLRLSFANITRSDFHQKRLEYHKSIQEDFFSNYRISEIKSYQIKEGDNIWELCNREWGIPFWLLVRYNKNINLLKIFPGETINVPFVSAISESELADNEAE